MTNTVTINGQTITRNDLRKALHNWECLYNRLQSVDANRPLKEEFLYSTISEVTQVKQPTWFIQRDNCNYCVVLKKSETFTGYELVKDFVLALNDEEGTCITVNYDEAWKLLGDKTYDEQQDFFRNLDLTPLNNYVSKLLNIKVEFKKELCERHGSPALFLTTEELAQHSGIMQANLKSLKCETFGTCHFYIDRDGFQQVSIASIHFAYQHKDGGSNGSNICTAFYYVQSNKWVARAIGSDKIEELN